MSWTNRVYPWLPDTIEPVREKVPRTDIEDYYEDIRVSEGNLSITIGWRHYFCQVHIRVDSEVILSGGRSMLTGIFYTNDRDEGNEELIKRSLELIAKSRVWRQE